MIWIWFFNNILSIELYSKYRKLFIGTHMLSQNLNEIKIYIEYLNILLHLHFQWQKLF